VVTTEREENAGVSNVDPSIDPNVTDSCESAVQKQWVYNNMQDYYLFYDQVPVLDPQAYATPEELLNDLRFEERDPFSHLRDAGVASLQFDEGREFGLGYRWGSDDDDRARLTRVVTDSPFGRAGLERGDIIVSLNNVPWADFPDEGFRDTVFGTPDSPATTLWKFEKRNTGDVVDIELTASEYAINTVLHKAHFTHSSNDSKVGYLAFSRFLNTSRSELETAFEQFRNDGITDLVLDLRYNSGGRVSIARLLSSLIAGNSRANQELYQYEFNDKYPEENYSLMLHGNVGDLGLSRVIVLTRGGTASSSEIVINGLKPYMEVITMGSTTSGKPYIQRGRDRCGKRLYAIEAEGFNAAGVSVFGGVSATCYARDDRTHDFGFNESTGTMEGMLGSALDYISDGTCLIAAPLAAESVDNPVASTDVDTNEKQGSEEFGGSID
jgi:C-terminal processing protease CtpA/Prc